MVKQREEKKHINNFTRIEFVIFTIKILTRVFQSSLGLINEEHILTVFNIVNVAYFEQLHKKLFIRKPFIIRPHRICIA